MLEAATEISSNMKRQFGFQLSDKRKIGAYILIKIAPGKSRTITEVISRVKGVKTAHPVTGMFDIIAFVEAADINHLTDIVRTRIQTIEGVLRTHTAIVGELVTTGG